MVGTLAIFLVSYFLLGIDFIEVIGAFIEIAYFVRLVIAFGLVLLSLTLYLDSEKSQQPTPLSHQLLRFAFHILLMFLMF